MIHPHSCDAGLDARTRHLSSLQRAAPLLVRAAIQLRLLLLMWPFSFESFCNCVRYSTCCGNQCRVQMHIPAGDASCAMAKQASNYEFAKSEVASH